MRTCVSRGEPLDAYLVAMQPLSDPPLIRQSYVLSRRRRLAALQMRRISWPAGSRALARVHAVLSYRGPH